MARGRAHPPISRANARRSLILQLRLLQAGSGSEALPRGERDRWSQSSCGYYSQIAGDPQNFVGAAAACVYNFKFLVQRLVALAHAEGVRNYWRNIYWLVSFVFWKLRCQNTFSTPPRSAASCGMRP